MKGYFLLIAIVLLAFSSWAQYNGNTRSGFGGETGNSTLSVTDNGTNITFSFSNFSTNGPNNLTVIYIDSKTGGFTSTATLNDQQDDHRRSISGVSGSGRSIVNFATNFDADYAIALGEGFSGMWELFAGGNNSLLFNQSFGNVPAVAGNYSFVVDKGSLGITGTPAFDFVISNISNTAFRSNEGYGAGLPVTNPGWTDVTYSNFESYPFVITPLHLNSLTAQIVNDKVDLRWSTFSETNLEKFIIQKSNNGLLFYQLATVDPKNLQNGATYLYTDAQPNFGNTYYRIIARTQNGERSFSKIVKVIYGKIDNTLTIFPNPAQEKVNINLVGAGKGQYAIDILNDGGQKLIRQTFEHNGIDKIITIVLPVNLKKGPYRIYISNQYEFYKGSFIVQ